MTFLGIDLGTGSLKVAIVDESGREQAAASVAYGLETPHPGWAEISVQTWWRALCEAAARLPEDLRREVQAIGFSGQMHGVVLIDANGEAVRPAMLWPDTRALELLEQWPEPQPNPVAPGMAGPLLRWIVQNDPQSARKTRWALQPKDWLRVALGGAVATDPSDACATALADPAGAWDRALLDRLELPHEWFAPLAPSYAAGGMLSEKAAQALGLRAGIVLAMGAADTPCAALGSGLASDGDALLTTGTGGQIVVLAEHVPQAVKGLHRYRAASDHWYRMAAMQNVGVALERVRGWLSYEWADAYRDAFGHASGSTSGNASGDALGDERSATASTATGLTFLPYLTGERTPWLNPAARGGWLGLALDHTRGMMMRAAFEGVAFSLRAGLDAIRASGATVTTLKLAGGGSVDARWRQLLADALNVELYAVDCPNAAPRGAAILGGLASGHWHASDLAALAPGATRVAGPQGDAALAERYARFLDLYGRVESWFGETPLR
ncbi:Xylulose kinase [Paraburkholderia domus]|jgi:Sugar (pentulose and hexulose) kinases|uniref:Xylulose kinase n=1 Tax=Paraburkholderia domus TaxID=2793075 RepID=A0A9N8QVQ8_9BURK|nr:FGGY family carbohydrate kinase [Paraburkholderia domus]MBK5047461.1 carbohydrate kinase [Burkholderia sp. R-70006]MBK5059319.1 carbohydrate kinase [Burkholderia sp. R-70199]MBK5087072.1 carbohydrate kinase [Burkholderia sp. R-69927]MBK5119413.1 carbohydrate kinase [Burkholderia sp. R-69980]MBK5163401.1 carbohydrate kinase [Burkholderia sp. R-70211]MBK5179203.1 carbohydrate kinase [Burkholderia sp. R-69749]MCI0145478.1 carbohydrate kinase [Paraburkholderia sediminicola]